MKKDSLTGTEVIDYDFLGKKLYPPRKLKETDATKAVAMLFKELDSFYYPSKKKEKHKDFFAFVGRRGGRGRGEQKQPCMVKMFYTDSKKAHKEFLRNYMPQKNRKEVEDKPELFNEEYDEVPEEVILDYEENMDKRGFKFIISPESQKVPMKELVRQFVKNLENATGFKFTWLAVVHTNTEHIHSHLLINGIDKKTGKKIERFPPEIIKSVSREMASNICTALVGERSSEQIEMSRQKLPYAKRWTKIDDQIASGGGYYSFDVPKIVGNGEFEASVQTDDDVEIQRLNSLAEMGLAVHYRKSPRVYYLEKDWKEKLRAIGRYNTFLDARSRLRFTPLHNLELYTGETGAIEGVVSKVYNMNDEDVWNNAVVVENRKLNKAWYVPTRIKLKDEDVGKFISVKAERNQKGKMRPLLTILS